MPRKILIVDDSAVDRIVLAGMLGKEYTAVEAENGQEAYDILLRSPYSFSAVVTDALMPVMDGYDLVRRVRKNGFMAQIPIIVTTADADEDAKLRAVTAGANSYLAKPIEKDLLLAMVKNLVTIRETSAIINEMQKDKLTGIYNRDAFMKEAARMLNRREVGYYVMGSFDVDHFKVICDQYGARLGENVLKHIASVFDEGFAAIGGICCHVSEDRFAALYPARYQHSELIDGIHARAANAEGLASPLTFCVGRFPALDLSLSPRVMYDRALLAGESIKGSYGAKIAYYDERMLEGILREQRIVTDMERALADGEFVPWYQPQINHATGALLGAEALVRWIKDGSVIPPNAFLPIFEKNGFIYRVDQSVWRQVCAALRRWLDAGHTPPPVSVNISRFDLFQPDFIDVLRGLLEEYRLSPNQLRLEITESAFSESPRQIVEVAAELVKLGFTVEIDDFGSGYSSLNTLKDVPAQILKLDMRFLEAGHSQRGGNIVESVVRMAKWLGMPVVAEGVETREQADYLASIGCSYMQGFLYAKPMPIREYEAFFGSLAREERLLSLRTIENLDKNAFWDPASMDTLIFNSYVGGACIFEYRGGEMELIRINRQYAETLRPGATLEDAFGRGVLDMMDERNRQIMRQSVERAIETNAESVCETAEAGWEDPDELIYIRSTVRVIAHSGDQYLLYGTLINVTEQRAAEQKEQRLLAEMRDMMADMPGGFVRIRISPDGHYEGTYCNEGFSQLVGMDPDTIMHNYAANPIAHVHPDDVATVRAAIAEIRDKGEAHSARYRIRHAGGSYVYVTVFGRFTHDHSGSSYLNLYYTDVTAREKEDRQREMLMDNFPWGAGVYAFKDGQMDLVYQNDGFWELVGLPKDHCHDPAPMSAIHPDDIPPVMQKLAFAIEHGQDAVCDIRLRHLKLGYRPVRLVARVVPDEAGGYLIVATFIPNEQVEMSYQRMLPLLLSTIMEASGDYAFAKDKDFRYICCSPAFIRLAGLQSVRDAVGKTDFDLFPEAMARSFRQNDIALLESGQPMVDFAETVYARDGDPHYCRASKHILRDAAGESIGIYGVSRDITQERGALEQLRLVNDSIPGGIATYSYKGGALRVAYCNDGFCKLFGGTREGLARRGDFDPLHWVLEEDRAELTAQIGALVRDNTPMDVLFRIRVLGGGTKWINEKATATERQDDAVLFNAILFDITERQNINELLRISEEENNLAVQHGGSVVGRFDVAARTLTISKRVAREFSLPEAITDVPDEPIRLGLISAESADAYRGFFEAIIGGGKTGTALYQQRYFGDWRWIEAKSSTVFSDDGKPVKAVISMFDATDKMEKEAIYRKWQHSLEDRAPDSYTLFKCNLNKNNTYETREGALFFFNVDDAGLGFNQRAKAYAEQCVCADDRDKYIAFLNSDTMLASYYRGKRSDALEYRELTPDGSARWIRLTVDLVESPNSTEIEAYLMYENVDETKKFELQTKELSETDPLTGILNRATFTEKVNQILRASQPGAKHALLMLDVDGFKQVNDVFGHAAGDETLIELAAGLRATMRRDDLVARLGGDEFIVFLNNINDFGAAVMIAKRIRSLARKSFSMEVRISASIGIAYAPRDGADFSALYKKADAALYYVKGSGKDNQAVYSANMADEHLEPEPDSFENGGRKLAEKKRRMMIVDDSSIDHTLLQNIFRDEFIIEQAQDGNAALIRMRHYGSAISVVLLDLIMPGMGGFAVLEKMRESEELRSIPVIIVSGDESRETCLKAIRKGATDFITKPVDVDLIRTRVRSAVSRAENERLRAKNSLLEIQSQEQSRYEAFLNSPGITFVEYDCLTGLFTYYPSVSDCLMGTYDNRKLWQVLLSDGAADPKTVQDMRKLVQQIAEHRDEAYGSGIAKLKTPKGAEHRFRFDVRKQVNEHQLANKLILSLVDLEYGVYGVN